MEFQLGNIFVRTGLLEQQEERLDGHEHNFDHVTYCTSGRLAITVTTPEGVTDQVELTPGDLPVLVKAASSHTMVAKAPNTGYHCIYAHRTPQGEVTQQYTGWPHAYT